jgi:hypothetical protein
MRKTVKTTALVSAPTSVATATADVSALIARIVESSPEAAKALALSSLMRPSRTRVARNAQPVTEADRAVAAANMSAGFRQTIFRTLIAMLGDKPHADFTVAEISEKAQIATYRVRADLQTIANRLSDFEKFPGIGYSVVFSENKRGLDQTVRFSRIAAKPKRAAKGKALTVVQPTVAPATEGEKAE